MYLLLIHGERQKEWDGTIPAKSVPSLRIMAGELQMSVDAVRDGIAACTAEDVALLQMEPNGDMAILGWGEEWRAKAMTDAERARKYRTRGKDTTADRHETVTDRDAGVTNVVTGRDERDGERDVSYSPSLSSSSSTTPRAMAPALRGVLVANHLLAEIRSHSTTYEVSGQMLAEWAHLAESVIAGGKSADSLKAAATHAHRGNPRFWAARVLNMRQLCEKTQELLVEAKTAGLKRGDTPKPPNTADRDILNE